MARRSGLALTAGSRRAREPISQVQNTPPSPSLRPPASSLPRREASQAFTLIELLITILVIAMLAGMMLVMFYRAQESARAQRTHALVTKLDAIIKGKWEDYKTRRVPITVPPGTQPPVAARLRLDGLRDLMRWELPERYTDLVQVSTTFPLVVNPAAPATISPVANWPYSSDPIKPPALASAYVRRMQAAAAAGTVPTVDHQGAEMLYLIVMAGVADDSDARDVFKTDGAGDTDSDGMLEFLDGWGRPIQFLRWAPGFLSELSVVGACRGKVVKEGLRNRKLAPVIPANFDYLNGSSITPNPGRYVGCNLAEAKSDHHFDPFNGGMARIVRDGIDPMTGDWTFWFTTPPYTGQLAFGSGLSGVFKDYVLLAPDPFDPSGVYPIYPPNGAMSFGATEADTSIPPFAIYPLVYSAGPDGYYGVRTETDGLLNYADPKFAMYPYPTRIGSQERLSNETGGAWVDNIHNHMLQAAK
ncbi:MAG: type II secretion system protein [Pirellulales bacterium]